MKVHLMLLAPVLLIGGAMLLGCESDNQGAAAVEGSSSPYAGGNGAFGEDPVNPGEHSGEQFRRDAFGIEPTTQSAAHR